MITQTPDVATNHRCANCGAHVSATMHRVLANNEGELHGCPECTTREERLHGATRSADAEPTFGHGRVA